MFAYYSNESWKHTAGKYSATVIPEVKKPEELILLETLLALRVLPVDGGYLEQPWLLIKCLEAAAAGKALYQNQAISGLREERQDATR